LVAGRSLEGIGSGAVFSAQTFVERDGTDTLTPLVATGGFVRASIPTSRRPTAASWGCGRTVPAARCWCG